MNGNAMQNSGKLPMTSEKDERPKAKLSPKMASNES